MRKGSNDEQSRSVGRNSQGGRTGSNERGLLKLRIQKPKNQAGKLN